MSEEIVSRPLVTITNVIWSFNANRHQPQLLLIKRANQPFANHWALPETLLRSNESAETACIRLIKEKIGLIVSLHATEQLATFTDPDRVAGSRALALAYMTYLPSTPALHPGYGATAAQWFCLSSPQLRDLAFDHVKIIQTAIERIKGKLDYQPTILHILGPVFTLRQAREVYAAFLGKRVDQIDNSNFKKTHARLFKEVGTATSKQAGRPPKLYRLNLH